MKKTEKKTFRVDKSWLFSMKWAIYGGDVHDCENIIESLVEEFGHNLTLQDYIEEFRDRTLGWESEEKRDFIKVVLEMAPRRFEKKLKEKLALELL